MPPLYGPSSDAIEGHSEILSEVIEASPDRIEASPDRIEASADRIEASSHDRRTAVLDKSLALTDKLAIDFHKTFLPIDNIDKPFFYTVRKGEKIFYLLGTCHTISTIELPLPIQDVIAKCKLLWIECVKEDILTTIESVSGFENNCDAFNKFDTKTQEIFLKTFELLNIPKEKGMTCKPWVLYFLYICAHKNKIDIEKLSCMDREIAESVQRNSGSVFYLETSREALEASELPKLNIEQIQTLLDNEQNTDYSTMIDLVKHVYRLGDLEKLAKFKAESGSLMDDNSTAIRNRKWLPKILKQAETLSDSFLVAVGAAHLTGDTGLLKLFEQQGYTIEPYIAPAIDLKITHEFYENQPSFINVFQHKRSKELSLDSFQFERKKATEEEFMPSFKLYCQKELGLQDSLQDLLPALHSDVFPDSIPTLLPDALPDSFSDLHSVALPDSLEVNNLPNNVSDAPKEINEINLVPDLGSPSLP